MGEAGQHLCRAGCNALHGDTECKGHGAIEDADHARAPVPRGPPQPVNGLPASRPPRRIEKACDLAKAAAAALNRKDYVDAIELGRRGTCGRCGRRRLAPDARHGEPHARSNPPGRGALQDGSDLDPGNARTAEGQASPLTSRSKERWRGGARRCRASHLDGSGASSARPSRSAVAGCHGTAGKSSPAPALSKGALFYHPDHLGGVALETGADGAQRGEHLSDPFGAPLSKGSGPYAFTGKELDADTGLYEFGARVYDPEIGLFLSPDPAVLADPSIAIGDAQLLSLYGYVRNSPTSHMDPDGRLGHVAGGAVAGGAIGGGAYLIKAAFSRDFTLGGLASSVLGGAAAGAAAAATGGASLFVQGATSGVAGGIVQRGIETRSVSETLSPKAIAVDAMLGAAGGAIAKGASSTFAPPPVCSDEVALGAEHPYPPPWGPRPALGPS